MAAAAPAITLLIAAIPLGASAAPPNEIKVFTDELANYREHTLETHVNKAAGAAPLQVMPEYSYGLRPDWEVSLQLPLAFTSDASRLEGYRAELQYVAPHDEDAGFYWGVNFELARIARLGEASFWNAELIPIVGYRRERWHLVANPGVDKAVSGARGSVLFQPAFKLAYLAREKSYVGLEYYVDAGPLRHRLAANEQDRVLYLVWDGKVHKSDLNIGIGRGLTDVSDRWIVKMIYEFAF